MNIAFLNSIETETYGGMEEWIRLVAGGLAERGHAITLMGRPNSRYLQRVGRSVPDAHIIELRIAGDFDPVVIAAIRKIIDKQAIDILCVNFNKDIRLGGIAARLQKRARVIWSVGINIAKDKLSHRLLTPRLVDKIIVPSESLREELLRHGFLDRERLNVIPIGIGDDLSVTPGPESRRRLREKYSLPDDAITAVTVGRFVYKKAHEYLIDAAPDIIKQFPRIYFLFLGDGPKEKIFREQIESLGLKDRFIFAGMLDNIDLELAGSDLMIHPSKEEPFGIALLEGMRAGLPIAASRVGGIPEVVVEKNTAVLFEPCNSTAISESVTGLLSDTDAMKRYGENGRNRWRERFSYEHMIDRVENCFASALPTQTRIDRNADPTNHKLQSA